MKKILYTIFIAAFFVACSGGANKEDENKNSANQEEVTPETATSQNKVEVERNLLLGIWALSDPTLRVEQFVTYSEDGTYNMKMATLDVTGTWRLNKDTLFIKSSPEVEEQEATITKLDKENLWTIWESEGVETRELRYSRK